MISYSSLAYILENDRNYGRAYIALFSLVIITFIFGKLESDRAKRFSYIKSLTVVSVIYISLSLTLSSTISSSVSSIFRDRAVNRLSCMGIEINSFESNTEYLRNLIYTGYESFYGKEPNKYYINSFIDKVLSNYYNNKNLDLKEYSKIIDLDSIKLRR